MRPETRPDPRCCRHCGRPESNCDNSKMFRSTPCCSSCDHDNEETT